MARKTIDKDKFELGDYIKFIKKGNDVEKGKAHVLKIAGYGIEVLTDAGQQIYLNENKDKAKILETNKEENWMVLWMEDEDPIAFFDEWIDAKTFAIKLVKYGDDVQKDSVCIYGIREKNTVKLEVDVSIAEVE